MFFILLAILGLSKNQNWLNSSNLTIVMAENAKGKTAATTSLNSNSSNIRCYAHLQNVVGDIPFKESTWSTYLRCVGIWKELVGNQAEIARCFVKDYGSDSCLEEIAIPEDGGYHRKYYNYLMDSSKQARAVKKKQKEDMSCKGTWYLAIYSTVY